ncbi:MAG: SprT family zinc-dependent metalloprotease [Caulobacteraceae bacterium]
MAASTNLVFDWGGAAIPFSVLRSDRRTLRIAVTPEGEVVVSAPQEAHDEDIVSRVRRRGAWIVRQQARFDRWRPRTPPRQYESGETHLLLGRRYRLLKQIGPAIGVRLDGDRIILTLPQDKGLIFRRTVIRHWYQLHAHRFFPDRLTAVLPPFARQGVERPRLVIREMTHRWGSFTAKGVLVLNLELVRASPSLIDYVIAHELAHALHPDHGTEWEDLLTRVLPDWRARKEELERQLL